MELKLNENLNNIPKTEGRRYLPLRRGYSYKSTTFTRSVELLLAKQKFQYRKDKEKIKHITEELKEHMLETAPPIIHPMGLALEASETMKLFTLFPHLGLALSAIAILIESVEKKRKKHKGIVFKENEPV